jgi:hypothetical protein
MAWPWRRRPARHAAVPEPRPARWAEPARPPTPTVRLGFGDGSELELADGDPSAIALRAVADLLVQDQRADADNKDDVPMRHAPAQDSRRIV